MTTTLGKHVWFELYTTNVEASATFFTSLFGWTVDERDMGDGNIHRGWLNNGKGLGGLAEVETPGQPSHWVGFVHTESVTDAAARAAGTGGTVNIGRTDIGDTAAYGVVTDSQGTVVGLYEGPTEADFDYTATGMFGWSETSANDVAASRAFYAEVFNWTAGQSMAMPEGEYHMLNLGDHPVIGLYQKPAEAPMCHWTHYVNVEDAAASIAKATALGGNVIVPATTIPGMVTFAVLTDPTGAIFGIAQPAAK